MVDFMRARSPNAINGVERLKFLGLLSTLNLQTPNRAEIISKDPAIQARHSCVCTLNRVGLLKGALSSHNLDAVLTYTDIKELDDFLKSLEMAKVLETEDVAQFYFDEALTQLNSMRKAFDAFLKSPWKKQNDLATSFLRCWSVEKQPPNSYFIAEAFHAARTADIQVLETLSRKGVDLISLRSPDNNSLMHSAAGFGHKDLLLFLKEKGAVAHIEGKNGATPIYIAAINKHLSLLPILVTMGADVNFATVKTGHTLMHLAIEKENIPLLKILKHDFHANLNAKKLNGSTAAHDAVCQNKLAALQCLYELGADLNLPDLNGKTPFDHALKNGHVEMVDALANYGIPLNTPNPLGAHPLLSALFWNDSKMVMCLLQHLDAKQITFFFFCNDLLFLIQNHPKIITPKLLDMINTKPEISPNLIAITLEEFVVALENTEIYNYLTQGQYLDDPEPKALRYQASFFKPFDPDIATRLLIAKNRYGNIEARHTSSAAQEEYDKVWGLILR